MYDEHKFYDQDYNIVCVHAPNCQYQNISPFQCELCIKDQQYGIPDRVKLVPTEYIKSVDNNYLDKSCPITPVKERINIRREEYIQALVNGDAALKQNLDIHNEMIDNCYKIGDSTSDESEIDRSDLHLTNTTPPSNNPTDPPILPLFPLVGLKRRKVMYYVPLNVANSSFDALVDTGACLSAIPLSLFNTLNEGSPENIKICAEKPNFQVQAANGDNCNVLFKTVISFELGGQKFNEEFLVLDKMNTPLLGLPFFIYNKIDLLTSKGMLQMPNMTYQLNTMRKPLTKDKPEKTKQTGKFIGLFVKKRLF